MSVGRPGNGKYLLIIPPPPVILNNLWLFLPSPENLCLRGLILYNIFNCHRSALLFSDIRIWQLSKSTILGLILQGIHTPGWLSFQFFPIYCLSKLNNISSAIGPPPTIHRRESWLLPGSPVLGSFLRFDFCLSRLKPLGSNHFIPLSTEAGTALRLGSSSLQLLHLRVLVFYSIGMVFAL